MALLASWKLNDAANGTRQDATANNLDLTDTNSNVGVADGHGGGANLAAAYNSGTDKLESTNASFDDLTIFAVSFWYRPDTQDSTERFVWKGGGFDIRTSSGTKEVTLVRGWSTTNGEWKTPNDVLTINTWHHIVISYDGSSTTNDPTMWIDGVSQTITEVSTPAGTLSSDAVETLYIGNWSSTDRNVKGRLDDFRVYTNTLSQSDVDVLYALQDDFIPSKLLASWKLNDAANGTRQDSTANNLDLTDTNSNVGVANGHGGGTNLAAAFNSGTDKLESTDSLFDDLIKFSFSFWYYPDTQDSIERFVWKGGGLDIRTESASKTVRLIRGWSTTNGEWKTPDSVLTINTWHHIVISYDGSSTTNDPTMWIDGVSQTITEVSTPAGTLSSDALQTLYIGNWSSTDRNVKGRLDDFRVYTDVLTQKEVDILYDMVDDFVSPMLIDDFPVEYGARRVRSGGTGQINISGVYGNGAPTSVQARARNYDTDAVVKDWTTITGATISGGVWSGTLESIPASSAWLKIDARWGNDTSIVSPVATNRIGIGIVVAMAGQSLYDDWDSYTVGAGTPHASTRVFEKNAKEGEVPAGTAAIEFLNKLQSETGYVAILIQMAMFGSALQTGSPYTDGGTESWLDLGAGGIYQNLLDVMSDAADDDITEFKWSQGHRDADQGSVTDNINQGYKTALKTLFSRIRGVASLGSDLPISVQLLERRDPGTTPWKNRQTPNHKYQSIRNAQEAVIDEQSKTYVSATGVDLTTRDGTHHDSTGLINAAKRNALTTLWLHNSSTYTFHRGPRILRAEEVSSTVVDVYIHHDGGTDFTPTSGITGFEAWNYSRSALVGGGVPTAARQASDIIRLTFSSALPTQYFISYLYDKAPDINYPVIDNSSPLSGYLTGIALEGKSNVPIVVGKYKLSDAANGTRADDSFRGEDLTDTNTNVGVADGHDGGTNKAALFNSTTDRLTSNAADFDDMSSFSISTWWYPLTSSTQRAFTKGAIIQVQHDSQKVKLIIQHSGNDGEWTTPASSITLNTWNHVVVAYNGNNVANDPIIWIDNVRQTITEVTAPTGSRTSDAAASLDVGNWSSESTNFDGRIDDTAIFYEVVNDEEVERLFNLEGDFALGAGEVIVSGYLLSRTRLIAAAL